ncbi:hypothetical protein B0T26DRAFT_633635 [Lasiosphaeria miniovina]|uniref:R3H domain-containing protein n=1 Tax=Lasiosphaeria miniovina TaxID=1954250 RepID=A0AA40EGS5_9PEZI|nr:uncharacterized protein B0T26DRAFT_633635 [Lasiosphaeria miniovina]KAK0735003.1 hypothetical protein B0T26DRAFT_633635 [Lasiosphaeria miniovina]
MPEPQAAPPLSNSQRGSRGRRGRSRRGNQHGSATRVGDGERSQIEIAFAPAAEAPNQATNAVSAHDAQSGSSRGDRGRRGGSRRGRGGSSAQRSIVVSHRGHGGPLAPTHQAASSSALPSLSAAAPEFVPGKPLVPSRHGPPRSRPAKSTAEDLPTRIHEDIENGHYECVICTSEVVQTSRVWFCSICWTVAHLHCVRKWHTNRSNNREQQDQNVEEDQSWRCPGCNSSLVEGPGPYHCWCGKETDPKHIPGLPPHTCGQTCSKARATCSHKCPSMCHAGPCPPCTLMGPTQSCHCGKHTATQRCTETEYGKGWSCEEVCGDLLPCGEHTCSRPCHSGLCGACEIPILSACYCGKEHKEIPCDQRGDILDSFNYGQLHSPQPAEDSEPESELWFEGSFRCYKTCGRKFDCGYHVCQKPCHTQDESTPHCPFSPDVITHCACGKTRIESADARKSCRDPILHCEKTCNKPLPCGHTCPDKCHTGSCAVCTQTIDITCRCGRVMEKSACHQGETASPLCFRVCRTQLNCGRHECGEHCCSGEKKATERRKQKRNANENYEPEHICLQVCGRQLKCGLHTCQQLCHKGPCMSCPEAIFNEISCSCGRAVLHPPQPCGTRPPECRFPCTKARPCGHPIVSHQCHPEGTECPNCPFLVEKPCVCGKKTLKNQPCWFDEARCGLPCGKKLKCGTHECKNLCHRAGQCEDADISGTHCAQPCSKVRKSCEHTCTDQCHAPFPCKEDKPCQSKTFITCPCQHRKQEVRCQATRLNPWPTRETSLKCDDECLRLQRNRLLADALKIDPETRTDDHIPYSDTTLKLFRDNNTWAQGQEREFRVFAGAADEKRLRFKPMPVNQRAFLHALAEDFGLDSESQDPEPHRHVCIFKTPRFVSAPRKTLAQCARIAKTTAAVGAAVFSIKSAAAADRPQTFNALLLKDPQFGLTIDELERALSADLAAAARSGPALTFSTSFLPSDEIIIKATPLASAAAVAASFDATPHSLEAVLTSLKPAVAKAVSRLKFAKGVILCHADTSLNITRREDENSANSGGWSSVVSRGGWRRGGAASDGAPAAVEQPTSRGFMALKKVGFKQKKQVVEEEVEDDWLTAAEKMEREAAEGSAGESDAASENKREGSDTEAVGADELAGA